MIYHTLVILFARHKYADVEFIRHPMAAHRTYHKVQR